MSIDTFEVLANLRKAHTRITVTSRDAYASDFIDSVNRIFEVFRVNLLTDDFDGFKNSYDYYCSMASNEFEELLDVAFEESGVNDIEAFLKLAEI